ncbi:sulfurtransferase complex subunit TusD [Litorivivens sp.]|uniref:sulfurtransferase complex subunit TusD n=1 Tax=Litorivivens sp. TaxID=2020868 RepID=UPI003566326C
MKFSLLILGSPQSSPAVASALKFAQASIAGGHELFRVFFFHDAVATGNRLTVAPQDQACLPLEWQGFAKQHNVDMVLCVSSALRRGIVDQREAERYRLDGSNMLEGFELSGLGQWVEAMLLSDRIVTFGG